MNQAAHIAEMVESLTLEEKVSLLTGRDFWTTVAIPRIGLRSMVLSDGPSGIRGERWDEREPSLNLPNGAALASTWDRALARQLGLMLAQEAERKGVDVVLGPTINIQRTARGGRNFESFGEDPTLSGELAAAYVQGIQSRGKAATPKHYVANDQETERFTVDIHVDEQALHELYLAPFERAVVHGGAWAIMSSYNGVNGTTLTEHSLLDAPLKSEWGFDGVVVSDWGAVRSLHSASAAQDLAMPGPEGPWGEELVSAVQRGEIDESDINEKVERLLRLAARVGALAGYEASPAQPESDLDDVGFARTVAVESAVLLRNTGVLPIHPAASEQSPRIAVIGQGATHIRTQGGGSATVIPERLVEPLDAIRAAFGSSQVTHAAGPVTADFAPFLLDEVTDPETGKPGVRVLLCDENGGVIHSEHRLTTELVWLGNLPRNTHTLELRTLLTPRAEAADNLALLTMGDVSATVDGRVSVARVSGERGVDLGAAFQTPPMVRGELRIEPGHSAEIVVSCPIGPELIDEVITLSLGRAIDTSQVAAEAAIAEAVRVAEQAEIAVVFVGTSPDIESEGFDRPSTELPANDDRLVAAVARVNPATVVIVNAGSPVAMPWIDDVAAVLVVHFGGQELGPGIAELLAGSSEPGGRLVSTWSNMHDGVLPTAIVPDDGVLTYSEGVHVGYRAWLRTDHAPRFPFGFGLGYTSWALSDLSVTGGSSQEVTVLLRATNTGTRAGKHVVQVYASRRNSMVDRPAKWLVAFQAVRAEAGETVEVKLAVPRRAFEHWEGGWQLEPGEFELHVGSHVLDSQLCACLQLA